MRINLNEPLKPNLRKLTRYLELVNESGWYTNFGPLHQQLTERLESYLGVKNLLLVSNGTLALQVAYKALNVNKALTTPFSFVATSSSLMWQGIETLFSDVDRDSYNLCVKKAAEVLDVAPNISSIIATHVYGNPCDVNALDELAEQKNVKIIYDAAHAFGVKIDGDSVLNFGDASTLSFHATKVFHCIEGGAIVFKRKADFDRAKRLINFGISASDGQIEDIGINAKLNEYQCAVGLTLLDDIDDILKHRGNLFNAYRNGLDGIVDMPTWHPKVTFNGAYMPIKLESSAHRESLENRLNQAGIQSRQYFSPSLDEIFVNCENYGTSNSLAISKEILCLPLHYHMTLSDVADVISIIKG